jgi:para-nitrobenzyl esterase
MSEPAGGPVVTLQSGKIRGVELAGGIARFLGVPYAAPPVGDNRFALPTPHEPWGGERDTTVIGPTPPYNIRNFEALDLTPVVGSGWVKGDDYLTLAIWAPDLAAKGLPVMVYMHGGGFVGGCNHVPVLDGEAFARSGVVYMSMNVRLGIEGFLPIPGAPTNLGLRDMIAALHWIRDNAAAFGGDPSNITLFGESSGAMSIADLLASPLAKGLFKRAIIQSGHGSMVRPIPVARRLVKKLANLMKVTPDVAGFKSRTVEQCLAALGTVQLPTTRIDLRDKAGREPAYGVSRFLPVYGDDVLPERPLAALAKGAGADVEVLIGTCREEMNLYFVAAGVKEKVGKFLAWLILSRSEPRASRMLKAYGMGAKDKRPGEVMTDAMTDLVFRLPARVFAAAHQGRTHMYEFEWRSPAFKGEMGAAHAMDVPFVFNTIQACAGPKGLVGENPPQALADSVHKIWTDFGKDGTLPWPEYNAQTRQIYWLAAGAPRTDPVMPAEAIWR